MPSSSATARSARRRCRRRRSRRSSVVAAARAVGRRGRRSLHARDDGRDERAARAQGRAHGVRDERGLRAPAAPAAPEPRRRSTGCARRIPSRSCRSSAAFGVRGRIGPAGELEPLELDSLPELDAEAVAICLLHAYRDAVARARGRGRGAASPAGRARRCVARDRAGVPRVRARVDDGDRRVPRPGRVALPARACRALRRRRAAGAARDALVGRCRGAR